jgi:hypothetical protein
MREIVRVISAAPHKLQPSFTTDNQSDLILSGRTSYGGFRLDSELSPHLCAETIHAGENPAQSGDRTRSRARNCSCTPRRLANPINDPTFIGSLSYPVGPVYIAIRGIDLCPRTPEGTRKPELRARVGEKCGCLASMNSRRYIHFWVD